MGPDDPTLMSGPVPTPGLVIRCQAVTYTADPAGGAITVGRESPAQVLIDDPRISRSHVRVEPHGGSWVAIDTSRNGMFLDDRRCSSVSLTDGMTLRLGDADGIAVRFELVDPAERTLLTTVSGTVVDDDEDTWTGEETDPSVMRAGAAVAARRDRLGITQRELARNKVMNAGALIAFEKGRSWPRKQTLGKLEDVLGWPPGTIARIRHGAKSPDEEATEVLTNTVQAPLMAQAVELALGAVATAVDALPATSDPEFTRRVAAVLIELRKLEKIAADAARTAKGTPEVVVALSTVRRRYDELMLRAAQAPTATLGQRLYAARRGAELTPDETANAAGLPVDIVAVAETDGPLAEEAAAALESLIGVLTNR
jgi:pSer/pThr/pTyr-binding forkhead associated (FHA) protein